VKGVARLILFTSIFFTFILLTASAVTILQLWIRAAQIIPPAPFALLPELLAAVRQVIPFAMYITILFSLSYSSRRNIPALVSTLLLTLLVGGFVTGLGEGLDHLERSLGLTESTSAQTQLRTGQMRPYLEGSAILVGMDAGPDLDWVISQPGRPLSVRRMDASMAADLSDTTLQRSVPSGVQALTAELSTYAEQFRSRRESGRLPYIAYVFSLAFFLASFRFVLQITKWPLADLFLGTILFRWLVALDLFAGSPEVTGLIAELSHPIVPRAYALPFGLAVLAFLLNIFMVLNFLARDQSRDRSKPHARS